ncbi:hypothetical protein QYM36_008535 [Artemia franciscana]|uniref:Uncharacterized protein n=1 Tax=Artemia franciscana TaxID=6661 RepID=A0AA88IGY6_ARTSF|nr:hypothetical protein QYM36_008535 [Artemia franciscana]
MMTGNLKKFHGTLLPRFKIPILRRISYQCRLLILRKTTAPKAAASLRDTVTIQLNCLRLPMTRASFASYWEKVAIRLG